MIRSCCCFLIALVASAVCVAQPAVSTSKSKKAITEITGKVLGYDGKPMPRAVVILSPSPYDRYVDMAEADRYGNYRLSTDGSGLFVIGTTGINHPYVTSILIIEKPRKVHLDIILTSGGYRDTLDEATVVAENVKGALGLFKKQLDGTYVAEFDSKEKSLQYVISKVSKLGTINGTQAGSFVLHDSGTIYFSIATPSDGKVRITLDPAKLPPYSGPARFTFGDQKSLDAQLHAIYRAMEDRKPGPQQVPAKPTDSEITELIGRIRREKGAELKRMLWLDYLDLTVGVGAADPTLVGQALDALTPTSELWRLRFDLVDTAVSAANKPAKYASYVESTIDGYSDTLKTAAISGIIGNSLKNKNDARADTYLRKLAREFPDHPATKGWRKMMERGKSVTQGKMVPAFAFNSFDDPKVILSNANVKAKVYLVDFWATWCHPCIRQMPYLEQAYAKYRSKGFEIISYSFDSNRDVVRQFRNGKITMPWLHAIDPELREMEGDPVAKQFELVGIPTAFLVNSDGKILATTFELANEGLERVLAEIFSPSQSSQSSVDAFPSR